MNSVRSMISSEWIHKILNKVTGTLVQPSDENRTTKPKAKRKPKDCTKFTLRQLNTVIHTLAKVNSCKHKKGYKGPKNYREATIHLNKLFNVDKSESTYTKIWLTHARKLKEEQSNGNET